MNGSSVTPDLPEPENAPLPPAERLQASRERLRLAMLARVPARAVPESPSAFSEAADALKRVLPGGDAIVETASEHRTALIVGGVALALLIARPWRLLLKPKVLVAIAVPLAAYGIRRVPTRVWMNMAVGLARMVWTRRKRRRADARERRRLAEPSDPVPARAAAQRVRAGTRGDKQTRRDPNPA